METHNFWASMSLEQLAKIQGVSNVDQLKNLYGTWPGSKDDGFEDFVKELRDSEVLQNKDVDS